MKNNILKIALFITRFVIGMTLLLAVILVGLMIVWQMDVSFLDNFQFLNDGSIFRFETNPRQGGIPLRDYDSGYFYLVASKGLLMTGVLYLILQQVLRVIKSISSFETFKTENAVAFQRMGQLFIVWLILAIPGLREQQEALQVSFVFHFKYIVYALICFVLAEIFSEGNRLMEENKLTI